MATVRVVVGVRHEASSDRIQVNVADEGEEVFVRRAAKGFVATLEDVAHLPVPTIETLRVGLLEALHESGEWRFRGADDQVEVVGHEAVRIERHRVSRAIRGEPIEIGLVVAMIKEDRLAAIAAGDDVIDESGSEHSRPSGHAS
jgi:hypothetical protein